MIAQRATLIAGTALFGVGLWQAASGLYIHAKAILAQHLLDHAWQRARDGVAHAKPWPWADTWPVARLTARGLDSWVYVLADASGRSLAFGPQTWPHLLARALLCEQVYRALTILAGHPYHRA